MSNYPETVGDYKIVRPLGRGYYGVTFVVENILQKRGSKKDSFVLKIIPKKLYENAEKDFDTECNQHADASRETDFFAKFVSDFEATITFGDVTAEYYVAVLEFVEGRLLSDYFSMKVTLTAEIAAQVAVDLFRIRDQLSALELNHNDLHAGNIIIQELPKGRRRQGAMNPSIRAVAIDLGSLTPDRREDEHNRSDIHWIATHMVSLADLLNENKTQLADLEARLSLELRQLAQSLMPQEEHLRLPQSRDIIQSIEDKFYRSAQPWRPWRKPLNLRRFDDSYNAQTLYAWNVPHLLVDPEDLWQSKIATPGPLVVTGMRGCGKTMLLRALQFHARAARRFEETPDVIKKRVASDGYVGFFVQASHLLRTDKKGKTDQENMFARLVLAYALQIAHAIAHYEDLYANPDIPPINVSRVCDDLNEVLGRILKNFEPSKNVSTVLQLENYLVQQLNKVCELDSTIKIGIHPSQAFPALAQLARRTIDIWENSQILFLLDDVSTRYLTPEQIEVILSALIFHDPNCAFKITSETHTIFLDLKSPGGVEPASPGRDFETFDLGVQVHEKLKKKGGKDFICKILQSRASFYSSHPQVSPATILGDVSLTDIAKHISMSRSNSSDRKSTYHGISALKAICVGDIGSVIKIYESMLRKASGSFPISPLIQSTVFQDTCSGFLYNLDRRDSSLKAAAKSFAVASHNLLIASARNDKESRLRQYTSIYVNINSGDLARQGKRIRELVDAGVFVFSGGVPRSKTHDQDPIHQFRLSYRKIFGLADFIGLSDKDRFELAGKDLESWLESPESSTDILMRNLSETEYSDLLHYEDDDVLDVLTDENSRESEQGRFDFDEHESAVVKLENPGFGDTLGVWEIEEVVDGNIEAVDLAVLALGFEERCIPATKSTLKNFMPSKVIAIEYPEKRLEKELLELIGNSKTPWDSVDNAKISTGALPNSGNSIVIDISSLTKSAIFYIVKEALDKFKDVYVSYSRAEVYYPLESHLTKILSAQSVHDFTSVISRLKGVLVGEDGPYRMIPLSSVVSDNTRMNMLFAFATPKSERLMNLVDWRDYQFMKILVDEIETARSEVARMSSEVAVNGATSGVLEFCDISDPQKVLDKIEEAFFEAYVENGMNFEIGLTGDKLETFAAAVFVSQFDVNKVWYVKPQKFDYDKFSKGYSGTTIYKVKR